VPIYCAVFYAVGESILTALLQDPAIAHHSPIPSQDALAAHHGTAEYTHFPFAGGEPILTALLQEPAIARHSPSLLTSLQDALAAHQSAFLRGLGTPQKRPGSKGAGSLSALPFDEEQDSRNIPVFKTQVKCRLSADVAGITWFSSMGICAMLRVVLSLLAQPFDKEQV
jgi:hypothetical protein